MGFHLQHGENGAFTGTKLRGLAESQGLELSADGTFKYYDASVKSAVTSGAVSPLPTFVMFNRDHNPFSAEMLRSSVVKSVTFQLDIPHLKNATEAFDQMLSAAKQMETGLNAQLVDDNNRPLNKPQIEKIRHQLKIIQATMLTKGIAPGSDCAHRLFS
jgi:FtsZ-interacting cell division protein ZipA